MIHSVIEEGEDVGMLEISNLAQLVLKAFQVGLLIPCNQITWSSQDM